MRARVVGGCLPVKQPCSLDAIKTTKSGGSFHVRIHLISPRRHKRRSFDAKSISEKNSFRTNYTSQHAGQGLPSRTSCASRSGSWRIRIAWMTPSGGSLHGGLKRCCCRRSSGRISMLKLLLSFLQISTRLPHCFSSVKSVSYT